MNINASATNHPARWATTTQADASRMAPMELDALGTHLGDCLSARGRWFGLECLGEAVHGFVAPRLVSTVALALLVLAASSLLA